MAILVNIDVPDLAKGISFYSAAFEMRLLRILDGDVAELVRGDDKFYLLKKDENTAYTNTIDEQYTDDQITAGNHRNYTRHWTPIHIDFVVDNLTAATQKALDAGATQENDCIEWRESKCITFSDPFGNGFCLIEFPEGTYRNDVIIN